MKLPIKIPSKADLLITVGQEVDFTTPFLKSNDMKVVSVPVAQILQFKPDKIFLNLKKLVGDTIQKGDLVAENKTMFVTKQYFSEHDGVIREINHQTGSLVIEVSSQDQKTINCFFKGEITAIGDDHLELHVGKYKEIDIVPLSEYTGAEVLYYNPTNTSIITEEDVEKRFIFADDLQMFEQVKLEALGAKGLITTKKTADGSFPQVVIKQDADFKNILELQYPYCIVGVDHNTMFFYH